MFIFIQYRKGCAHVVVWRQRLKNEKDNCFYLIQVLFGKAWYSYFLMGFSVKWLTIKGFNGILTQLNISVCKCDTELMFC